MGPFAHEFGARCERRVLSSSEFPLCLPASRLAVGWLVPSRPHVLPARRPARAWRPCGRLAAQPLLWDGRTPTFYR